MALETKYRITVNTKAKMFREIPEIVANDKVVFEIEVFEGATLFTFLPEYSYKFVSKKPSGNPVIREAALVNGLIRVELGSSEMTIPGKVEGTVQIFDSALNRISTAKFDYNVKRDPSMDGDLPTDDKTLVIANESILLEAIDKSKLANARIDTQLTGVPQPDEAMDIRIRLDGTEAPSAGAYVRELASSVAQSATKERLNDTAINVKDYGAIGDGVKRKIKDANPSITLSQVQALDSSATLDNSIDWYAIQKAINDNSNVRIAGSFVIDRPIVIGKSHISIIGTAGNATINNVGVGTPAIKLAKVRSTMVENIRLYDLVVTGTVTAGIMSGNGLEILAGANIHAYNCIFSNHGDNGLFSGVNQDFYIGKFVGCRFETNKNNGVLIEHYYSAQKNNIAFIGCRAQNNGRNDQGQLLFQLNTMTTTYGHGIKISGTSIFIGAGTDCEGNSGAGIYLGGSSVERMISGVSITGGYYEPNLLNDIYIDNSVADVRDTFIGGNWQGGDALAKSTGHLFISNPRKVFNSVILNDKYKQNGNKNIHDMRRSTSLYLGGEFESSNIFDIDKTLYPTIFGDGIKLTKDKNALSSFSNAGEQFIIFNSALYELQIDYYWNKVTPTSSVLLGFNTTDYDGINITTATLPNYLKSGYATLTQTTLTTDTVLHFDNLTGWDKAGTNSLVFYDTKLSSGVSVGTEFSRNTIPSSSISSIDLVANTITLSAPIGKVIQSGTQSALGNSPANTLLNTFNLTTNGTFTSQKFNIDFRKLPQAKNIRYMLLYLALNGATDANDSLNIRKIRIREIDIPNPNGVTLARPVYTTNEVGKPYFDVTLNKPIWWNGTVWKDATGTTV
jgi:hypothetical protein